MPSRSESIRGKRQKHLHITEIGHNPYELAAFLTVLYEDYTRAEVQETLRALFEAQYSLSTSHSIETVTETRTVRVGESLGQVVTSGYCNCSICCGGYAGGPTASGVMPTAEHTIAVDMYDPLLPFGTKVVMNGTEYVVEDTGPLTRYGVTFDVYYDDHDVAEAHGHQTWEAFLSDDNGEQEVQVTQTTRKPVNVLPLLAPLLLVLGGGGAFAFYSFRKKKKAETVTVDPDADYQEEEYDFSEAFEDEEEDPENDGYDDDDEM